MANVHYFDFIGIDTTALIEINSYNQFDKIERTSADKVV